MILLGQITTRVDFQKKIVNYKHKDNIISLPNISTL